MNNKEDEIPDYFIEYHTVDEACERFNLTVQERKELRHAVNVLQNPDPIIEKQHSPSQEGINVLSTIRIITNNIPYHWSLNLLDPGLSEDKCKELAQLIQDFIKQNAGSCTQ